MGAQLRVYKRRIQVRHRDQEDHQGDGDDRRLAHRQGAAQGGGIDAVRDRAHPRGDRGGDRLEHQAPADHRGRERRPAPRSCSSRATAVWPAATPPTPSRRRSGSPSGCAARARRSTRTSSAARVSPTTASASARSRSRGPASPTARRTRTPRRSPAPLIEAIQKDTAEGGVDELHIVYTEFVSMMTQTPVDEPAAAAQPRRGRGGERYARARSFRCSTSSRRRRTSSTPCCRGTSRAGSTTRCCRRPLPSTPPAAAR